MVSIKKSILKLVALILLPTLVFSNALLPSISFADQKVYNLSPGTIFQEARYKEVLKLMLETKNETSGTIQKALQEFTPTLAGEHLEWKDVLNMLEAHNGISAQLLSWWLDFVGRNDLAKELEAYNKSLSFGALSRSSAQLAIIISDLQEMVSDRVLKGKYSDLMREVFLHSQVMQGEYSKEKRALLYYILRHPEHEPYATNGEVRFKGIKGVSIHTKRGLVVNNHHILKGLQTIGKGRIFADMDDNLAMREEAMPQDMLEPFYQLTLYGLLPMEIVTDNEFKKAGMRLDQLPDWVKNMVPVYADGAGNKYVVDPLTLERTADETYRKDANAEITDENYDILYDELYADFVDSWQPFLLNTARHFNKYVENENFPRQKDIAHIFRDFRRSEKWLPHYKQIVEFLGIEDSSEEAVIAHIWKMLQPAEGHKEISAKDGFAEIVLHMQEPSSKLSKTEQETMVFEFYQLVALVEMVRVLNSEDHRDDKQRKDLIKNFFTLDERGFPLKDGKLGAVLRDHVQIALKAIRPRIIRDLLGDYFKEKMELLDIKSINKNYFLYTGGSTTINIKRVGVSKATPVSFSVEKEKENPGFVIFTGNEMLFPEDPVGHHTPDDTVAALQLKDTYKNLLVFNTADRKHDENRRPTLKWVADLDMTSGKYGPQANSILHKSILDIMEEEIGEVISDPFYEPKPALELFREKINEPLPEAAQKEQKTQKISIIKRIGAAFQWLRRSIARIFPTQEYTVMLDAFDSYTSGGRTLSNDEYIFDTIRKEAKLSLGKNFNEDNADFAIVKIKEVIIPSLIANPQVSKKVKDKIKDAVVTQASQYINRVNGFGTIDYAYGKDDEDTIAAKEDALEDIWFASMQAIDALEYIGDPHAIDALNTLSRKAFAAHRETKELDRLLGQVTLLKNKGEEFREEAEKTEMAADALFESVRRWTTMQAQFLKNVSNLGKKCIDDDGEPMSHLKKQYNKANHLLIDVLGNYKATAEGWYWLRQQAAYRLKDFNTKDTLEVLDKVCADDTPEGQLPNPDTCYIAPNLDAANKNAISVKLQAGMTAIQLRRNGAYKKSKNRDQTIRKDLEKVEYRFATVLGVLDALVDPNVDEEARIDTLRELTKAVKDQEVGMAANVLLGALEELIGVPYEDPLFDTPEKTALKTKRVSIEAMRAYKLIANAVGENLKETNPSLYEQYNAKRTSLYTDQPKELKLFAAWTHVILGNLHRLSEMKSFEEGAAYLDISNYRIIIESGGGASVAMAGVINRMTKDRALAVISGTDNGGGTLLSRSFDATKNHIMAPAQGDIVRFDLEAAVMEAAPAAVVLKKLMGNRGWADDKTLVESLAELHGDSLKKARQSGQEEAFEAAYEKIKKYAQAIDDMGFTPVGNTLRNLMFVGICRETKGSGYEFMNPDGMNAALIEFRNLVGAKSFAVLDTPFGNEMIITGKDGQEYIGQSYYSHTPHGNNKGRQRAVAGMANIDTYYPAIAIHSKVTSVVKNAKLILSGLCSWGTSLSILLKNKLLMKAQAENKTGDKVLVTNGVKDDEIRGLEWKQSMIDFTQKMANKPLEEVWNMILANSNEGIKDKLILPARKEFGNQIEAYEGVFGGYCGVNTPTKENIRELLEKGIKVLADKHMMEVGLTPKRDNPDEYNASILMIAEKFAAGIWDLISEKTKKNMDEPEVFQLIAKHNEIENLLKSKGLSLKAIGIDSVHELVIPQNQWLVNDLSKWLYDNITPHWIEGKKDSETWFQYPIRSAIDDAIATTSNVTATEYNVSDIVPDAIVEIAKMGDLNISVQIMSGSQTNKVFDSSRTDESEFIREKEERERLGKVVIKDNEVTIVLPKDLWLLGENPKDRMRYVEAALKFNMEKVAKMKALRDRRQQVDSYAIHKETVSDFKKLAKSKNTADQALLATLGELSIAIPYLRFLRVSSSRKYIPITMFDMDGTFTAAGTPLDRDMAYLAWKFLKSNQTIKEVVTAQAFEGPLKQIVEQVKEIEHIMEWTEKRTDVPRDLKGMNSVFHNTYIGGSSGNAIFKWDEKEEGHVKDWQDSMKPVTTMLIEMAARCTIPKIAYKVQGHQIEMREPDVEVETDAKGRKKYIVKGNAAIAILISGRFDERRDFDPSKIIRIKQGAQMENLLLNPEDLMNQIEELITKNVPDTEWTITITDKDGAKSKINVLPEQIKRIKDLYADLVADYVNEIPEKIMISIQPGGATTNDVSPNGKDVGVDNGLKRISRAEGKQLTDFRMAMLGDEMCTFTLTDAKGEKIKASGNDLATAKNPHPQVDLLVHVGETGEDVETTENTTKAFNIKGTTPLTNLKILASSTAALEQGASFVKVMEKQDYIETVLKELGFTWKSFGISTIEKLYEPQAEEILAICENYEANKFRNDLQKMLSESLSGESALGILPIVEEAIKSDEYKIMPLEAKQEAAKDVLRITKWYDQLKKDFDNGLIARDKLSPEMVTLLNKVQGIEHQMDSDNVIIDKAVFSDLAQMNYYTSDNIGDSVKKVQILENAA